MDIRNLTVFLKAAELGSFTRAGSELGISQSTVSFQIRQLEEEAGVPLFDRIGRTVTVTDKGREFMDYARQVIRLTAQLEQQLQGENSRPVTVKIAMADSLCGSLLGSGFRSFREQHPGIRLKIISCGAEEMMWMLDHNEADAILTLESHIYNNDYVVVQEERTELHFAAAADSPIAREPVLTLERLLREPFILTEKGMSYRKLLDEQLAQRSMQIDPVLEVGNPHLICEMVCQGAGVSFLPDFVTRQAAEAGSLVRLSVPELQFSVWKQLLHHRNKWVSPQLRSVLQYCAEREFGQ